MFITAMKQVQKERQKKWLHVKYIYIVSLKSGYSRCLFCQFPDILPENGKTNY